MKRMLCIALFLIMALVISMVNAGQAHSWSWCWPYGPNAYPEPMESLPNFLSDPAYFDESSPEELLVLDPEFRGGWLYTAIATEAGSRNYLQQNDDGSYYTVFSTDDVRGCYYEEWGAWRFVDFDQSTLRLKDRSLGGSATLNSPSQDDRLVFYQIEKEANVNYTGTKWNLDLFLPAAAKAVVGGFNDYGSDDDFDDLIFILIPDTDKDLIANYEDNCPTVWNDGQYDSDSDLFGDLCDNCPITENDQSDSELAACDVVLQDDLFSGTGVADIDGQINADEWADAKRFYFDLEVEGASAPATLYVMNDARYLYFSLLVKGDSFSFSDGDIKVQGFLTDPSRLSVPGQEYEASYNLFDDQGNSLFSCNQGISFTVFGNQVAVNLTIQPAGDGVGDICDNCEFEYNPDQMNTDGDLFGDACDNCPDQPNTSDNNTILGTCSIIIDGQYVPCVDGADCSLGYCSINQENTDFLLELARDEDKEGDACDTDDDGDGMPDLWEILYPVGPDGKGLDPYDPNDAIRDDDGDGLSNLEEYENYKLFGKDPNDPFDGSTIPIVRDTDGDSWSDRQEKQAYLEYDLGNVLEPSDPTDGTVHPTGLFYSNGIFVDPNGGGTDLNIGTVNYPLASVQAAVIILNKLEEDQGPYTIIVSPGIYSGAGQMPNDNLYVKNDVAIQKEAGATGDVIFLGSANWNTGVAFYHNVHVSLINIKLMNFHTGVIFVSDGGCATLENVHISDCVDGIKLVETFQLDLDMPGSSINSCERGIVIETESANNTMERVHISDNDVGIALNGGTDNLLVSSTISGNGHDYGILFQQGAVSFTVRDSTIDGLNVGLGFKADGSHVTLENTFIQNCVTGIEFLENYMTTANLGTGDALSTVTGCTDAGILFRAGSSNNTVLNGEVTNNFKDGIRFEACMEAPDDNLISGTIVTNNANAGIALLEGSGNRIEHGIVESNQTGIWISEGSNGNVVQYGSVRYNTTNFSLEGRNNLIGGYDENGDSIAPNVNDGSGIGFLSGSGNQLIGIDLVGTGERKYGLLIGEGATDLLLEGMNISNFDIGIGFETNGACVKMNGVSVFNCGIGMDIAERYMLDIDLGDTQIYDCDTGVRLIAGSSNNTVRHGFISGNSGDGIRVEGCTETPDDNTFIGVTVGGNGRNGIAILDGFNNQVIDTIVSGNNLGSLSEGFGGIVLMNGSGSVTRSIVFNNGCHGIFVDEAAHVNLVGNLIYNNKDGVRLAFSNDVVIESNTIADNTCSGVWIEDGSEPDVKYSIIYGNGETGGSDECMDTLSNDTRFDIFLGGTYSPNKLYQNNIGNVNQIDLPPSNLSVNPKFNNSHDDFIDGDPDPYALQSSSFCIDATTKEDPGFDILNLKRPKGETWDMGAYESSGFLDIDDDRLPDPWEQFYFGGVIDCDACGANDDYDLDGVLNIDEYWRGTDPTNPLNIEIVTPASNPAYTGSASILVQAIIRSGPDVESISATVNDSPMTPVVGDGLWEGTVGSIASGNNFITVKATGTGPGVKETEDSLTVIRDSGPPTVTITDPTPGSDYVTALETVTLSGFASDDTAVTEVTYKINGSTVQNHAIGTSNWSTGPIELDTMSENSIVVTAHDGYNNSSSDQIVVSVSQIALEAGVDSSDEDQSAGVGAQPPVESDPRDADGDGYLNDDEIACGTDPLLTCPDEEACPDNYPIDGQPKVYPPGHEKAGYFWPNCLRHDIDEDSLPNWWETDIGKLNPLNADTNFVGHSDDVLDGDENPDNDAFTNLEEYENGTDPHLAQYNSFTVTVLESSYDNWLPQFGQALKVQAEWTGGGVAPAEAVFSLRMTSNYPGRAVNDPDPSQLSSPNYPAWYDFHGPDFGLTATDPGMDPTIHSFLTGDVNVSKIPNSNQNIGIYIVYLQCWDYGGQTKVLVRANDATGDNIGQLWVPKDDNRNGIADQWDTDNPLAIDPIADVDAINFSPGSIYTAPLGDDFSNIEEYRGMVYTEEVIPDPDQRLAGLTHLRMNPLHKDLFVRANGFDNAAGNPYDDLYGNGTYPFRLGLAFLEANIDVHNTTGWGHDATDDGSFYVYLAEGLITNITDVNNSQPARKVLGSGTGWSPAWPNHEWEFQLSGSDDWNPIGYWGGSEELFLDYSYDVSGLSFPGSYTYRIRKPLPHINILIVKLDNTNEGHIQFLGASPPSQQNPTGLRSWRWATKGYAWTNLPADRFSMYGLAVSLKEPLQNYFYEYPYKDGTSWSSSAWSDVENTMLDPLNLVEDQSDLLSPVDGILGDGPNESWDGDQRLPLANWSQGTLNPFDIDGDQLVELPIAADPFDVDGDFSVEADPKNTKSINEYSLQEVLMHTTTHEIGHALGGPVHTSDPNCLMYKYSKNWNRADYLSDYFKSLLRIHNKIR